MADKFLPKLSQNLLNILDDDEYYDITIEVGNDPYVKIFRAHMVILNYRSPYLKRILSTNKKHSDGTLVHIKLPSILPETFHEILRYIYGGRISLEKYNISDIINMLIAADKLCLPELVFHLQTFFIEDNTIWTEENFDLVYKTSFENVSFLELQNHCNDLISKEPDKIFKSPDFSSVPEKLLISLIKNDNLQMEEVQIWENVLKWGFAQHPELPPDSTILSKDEFNVLKNTIQQCIPFIKFINLSSREFFDKVLPYKKVLPKELKNELLNYFLDPNRESKSRVNKEVKSESQSNKESPSETRSNKEFPSESQANQSEPQSDKESPSESQVNQPDPQMNKGSQSESQTNEECQPELQTKKETSSESQSESQMIKEIKSNIESKIITNKHAELISGWIVDSSSFYSTLFGWVYGSNQYEFKLLFRGSRDGFTPPNFHNLCDNQTSTIMIIKVKDSNEILGGYNPIAWKNDYSNGITKDSFIFSFENENHILSRVKDENSAIKNSCYCVPSFGESDLTLSGYNYHYSYCKKGSYEKPIRNTEDIFSVEEFEVFKIHIKN
ncbi:BTB/POZ protein [Rhizophagus clarus]|uniref:BTB/POZ protein n=1 Tax=Rhizophagus clarus TaxID=94130 RepID=A0A8H3LVY5_9GLOM|nr:BTB/POZ protein [Rhizophagus clarus]